MTLSAGRRSARVAHPEQKLERLAPKAAQRSVALPLAGIGSAATLWPLGDERTFLRNKAICEPTPFLEAFPGDPRDVRVYRRGWWNVTLGAAGGLAALELVEGRVEAPFYLRFVAGELREGVCFVCIPDKAPAKRGGLHLFLPGLH